jgi:hypothetical protein
VQKNTIALIWKGESERYDLSTSGKKASSGNSRGFFCAEPKRYRPFTEGEYSFGRFRGWN